MTDQSQLFFKNPDAEPENSPQLKDSASSPGTFRVPANSVRNNPCRRSSSPLSFIEVWAMVHGLEWGAKSSCPSILWTEAEPSLRPSILKRSSD
jgi:hypothetical protein